MTNDDLNHLYDVMIDYYHFASFKQKSRRRCVVEKKMMFALVAYRHGASYRQIADFFEWSCHSVAINAVKQMRGFIAIYPQFQQQLEDIERAYGIYEKMKVLAAYSD